MGDAFQIAVRQVHFYSICKLEYYDRDDLAFCCMGLSITKAFGKNGI